MPYCGPTFGLVDMHALTEHIHKPEEEGDAPQRQRGQAQKRRAPGEDGPPADPVAPDEIGDGLLKAGTRHANGIFQCPADMKLDITEGHTQSDVLDRISEAIRKLRQIESTLTGEDPDWVLEGEEEEPAPEVKKETKAANTEQQAHAARARVKRQATGAKTSSAASSS